MAQPIIRVKNWNPITIVVDGNFELNEVFLGFFHMAPLASTDGKALSSMILDVPLRCNLSVANLRGQNFDGDSKMAGRTNPHCHRCKNVDPKNKKR